MEENGESSELICSKCSKVFARVKSLLNHLTNVHGQAHEESLTCDICEKKFTRVSNLFRHKRQTHSENTLSCPYCSARYQREETLQRHVLNHGVDFGGDDGEQDEDASREVWVERRDQHGSGRRGAKRDTEERAGGSGINVGASTSNRQTTQEARDERSTRRAARGEKYGVAPDSEHPEPRSKRRREDDAESSSTVESTVVNTLSDQIEDRREETDGVGEDLLLPEVLDEQRNDWLPAPIAPAAVGPWEPEDDYDPLVTGDEDVDDVVRRNWNAMRTYRRLRKVVDVVNVRLWDGEDERSGGASVWQALKDSWARSGFRTKVNASFGAILRQTSTGKYRYFHASANNHSVFSTPASAGTLNELRSFYEKFARVDPRAQAFQRRPNTGWTCFAITNVSIYIYKLLGVGRVGKGSDEFFPARILGKRSIMKLVRSPQTGKAYDDNLCMFRCLAVALLCECVTAASGRKNSCTCRKVSETLVKQCYRKFALMLSGGGGRDFVTAAAFEGVRQENFLPIEEMFDVRLVVLEVIEGTSKGTRCVWSSDRVGGKLLFVNMYRGHFSYIRDVNKYASTFVCGACDATFARFHSVRNHACGAGKVTQLVFEGGQFKAPPTIFDELDELGIAYPPHLRFHPYRLTYDIETFMDESSLPADTVSTSFSARHQLLSISTCSNVPGFRLPKCFVRKTTAEECVGRFLDYITRVCCYGGGLYGVEMRAVHTEITRRAAVAARVEKKFEKEKWSSPSIQQRRKRFKQLAKRLVRFCECIPVVGFNSQMYDMNILKAPLLQKLLNDHGEDEVRHVIKKINNMACLETKHFKFLDVCNFIAPGYSYAQYITAFKCNTAKGFFPYEWMTGLEKLNTRSLPPKEAFYSSLRQTGISDEDYKICEAAWRAEKMTSMRDFLNWYNNLDVVPFLEALEKQSDLYKTKNIDMLKEGVSLPGLAVRWLMRDTPEPKTLGPALPHADCPKFYDLTEDWCATVREFLLDSEPIKLIGKEHAGLYADFKNQLTGGPAIVFHRHHEKDVTKIREASFGESAKTCKSILGVDANALYLWASSQPQPTGRPTIMRMENDFKPDKGGLSRAARGWLEYVAFAEGIKLRTEHRGGEQRVGNHNLPVDGYCAETKTIFQFHGCYWHAHPHCGATKGVVEHPTRKTPCAEIYADTLAKRRYFQSLGYNYRSIWECEWTRKVNADHVAKAFLSVMNKTLYPFHKSHPRDQEEAIRLAGQDRFFGYVECDISVPEELREKFDEMPPIFKNIELTRDVLGEEMLLFAKENDVMRAPQRTLIGSLRGERVLVLSTLLKWYIGHGLRVTKVYKLVAYIPRTVFGAFAEGVSAARRRGDSDSNEALLATTYKLVGNSMYGKTITNKEKHRDVRYTTDDGVASRLVGRPTFASLEDIGNDVFEVSLHKKKLNMDVPIAVGFTILQYAKLRMLQFYYDFMDRFISRRDFQYVEMDTDSAYMGLTGDLEDIVRVNKREEFFREYDQWFPRKACARHSELFVKSRTMGCSWEMEPCCLECNKFDARTPGLFKEEFSGDGIVALNAKTYFCWKNTGEHKHSSKGISKRLNALTKEQYLHVLQSKEGVIGVNRGFVRKDNQTYTYRQSRLGLTYFYAKRRVLSDGVSTTALDI